MAAILPGLALAGIASSPSSAAPAHTSGAQPQVSVANSNGSWSALGSGVGGIVFAMAKSDDTVYMGGAFTSAGGAAANYLAAWSPSDGSYSTLGAGVNSLVWALAVAADDSVYIGGSFTNVAGIAKWDPAARVLSQLGPGVSAAVQGLTIKDDTLYLGGSFTRASGGAPDSLARVGQWGPLSGSSPSFREIQAGVGVGNNTVQAVHVPANGNSLYLGGNFTNRLNGATNSLLRFGAYSPLTGSPSLSTVGAGISNGVVLSIKSSLDDTVFLGGSFTPSGATTLRRVGAWNPGTSTYSNLGYGLAGTDGVYSIAVDDTHSLVYVGGAITYACGPLANCPSADDTVPLNGVGVFDLRTQDWVPLLSNGGRGLNSDAYALVLDDSALYAGGAFTSSSGGTSLNRVAKWTWAPPSGNATIVHSGASTIAVPGQSFVGVSSVTIGGSPAPVNYAQSSSTQLTVAVPGLPAGNHPIVVNGVGGTATVGTYSIPVPSAPVVTAAAGQTSIDLTWTLDDTGGSAVTYQVALGSTSNVIQSTATPAATVTGLSPGTTYTAFVRAINNNGPGPWSTAVSATTQSPPAPVPTSPPGAPTGVVATPGNASATVAWAPPSDTGSFPVSGYVVRAQPGAQTCLSTSTSCTVEGLSNGLAYTFTVTAFSAAGMGPAGAASSPVTPRTTPAAPTRVRAALGDSTATITWSAPVTNGGAPITGYRVTTIPTSGGCTVTATTCTLTGLTNDQQYVVSVVATNAAGSSAPATATVTPRGNASIVITGTRSRNEPGIVKVLGTVTKLDVTTVQPYVRLGRQTTFQPAITQAPVGDEGRFRWQRATSKRIAIYVEAGDIRSNRVTID